VVVLEPTEAIRMGGFSASSHPSSTTSAA
jgi:hypothetical protein